MIKPVNLEALSKWVPYFPTDIRKDMRIIAPMLEKLGYDPFAYPPNYGDPDKFVAKNTEHIEQNRKYWDQKKQEVYSVSKATAKEADRNNNKSHHGYKNNYNKAITPGHMRLDKRDFEADKLAYNVEQKKHISDKNQGLLNVVDDELTHKQRAMRWVDYNRRRLAYHYRDQPVDSNVHLYNNDDS